MGRDGKGQLEVYGGFGALFWKGSMQEQLRCFSHLQLTLGDDYDFFSSSTTSSAENDVTSTTSSSSGSVLDDLATTTMMANLMTLRVRFGLFVFAVAVRCADLWTFTVPVVVILPKPTH